MESVEGMVNIISIELTNEKENEVHEEMESSDSTAHR